MKSLTVAVVLLISAVFTSHVAGYVAAPYYSRLLAEPIVAAPAVPLPAKIFASPPLAARTLAASAPVIAAAPFAAAPVAAAINTEIVDAHPQYKFAYDVLDTLTGDSKTQEETRNGDIVRGSYSLIEPDGSRRIVSYYADSINGFNAVVQKDVPAIAAKTIARVPAPVVANTFAAPIVV